MPASKEVLRKAQMIMLETLVDIDYICEKHKIKYWLDSGTLLGAVRHGGFIPWDDDVDIAMPYSDYKRFLEVCKTDLSGKYVLQNKCLEPAFRRTFSKVRRRGTTIIETNEDGTEKYHHGLFVDIYPFYYYDSLVFLWLYRYKMRIRSSKDSAKRGSIRRLFLNIYGNIILGFPFKIIDIISKIVCRKQRLQPRDSGRFITNSMEYGAITLTMTRDVFPLRKNGIFEGHRFYIPNNTDGYLRSYYGNYMTLPPKEERIAHNSFIDVDRELSY